jgi:prevent-host-death family protein
MNETVHTIEEAARCLPELVERVRSSGEPALLVKSGRPLARLVPVTDREDHTGELIAFLRRWRTEHPEPDDQLAEAIEKSRTGVRAPYDPWE